MKKIIVGILSVLLVFVLQSTVFTTINIGGIIPNLLVVLTACWGVMDGERSGLIVGFACGLLVDIFFAPFIGLYAIIYMYIGFLNGKFCNFFYPEDVKLPLILILVSDLIYGFSSYVFFYLLRGRFDFGFYFSHIIFPEIVATLICTLVQYPITLLVHNKILNNNEGIHA